MVNLMNQQLLIMKKLSAAQTFPKFSNGDITPWLRKFNEFCSRFKVAEADKIPEVINFLEGAASEWHYSCCSAETFVDWETQAKERFGITKEEVFDQLVALHISQFGKPEIFLDRFSNFLLQYQVAVCGPNDPKATNSQISAFRFGTALALLRHSLDLKHCKLLCANPPDNVDTAISLICRHARYTAKDAIVSTPTRCHNQVKKTNFAPDSEIQLPDNILETLVSEMKKISAYLVKGDLPRNQSQSCYNCKKQTNHNACSTLR